MVVNMRSMLPAAALAASAAGEAAVGRDRRLTPREEAKLLAPLLRLRQACCHPQVPHAPQTGSFTSLSREPQGPDRCQQTHVQDATCVATGAYSSCNLQTWYPQVGGGGIRALASSRTPLSMDEILVRYVVSALHHTASWHVVLHYPRPSSPQLALSNQAQLHPSAHWSRRLAQNFEGSAARSSHLLGGP